MDSSGQYSERTSWEESFLVLLDQVKGSEALSLNCQKLDTESFHIIGHSQIWPIIRPNTCDIKKNLNI